MMNYNVARTIRQTLLWRAAALCLGLAFIASVPFAIEPAEFGRFNLIFSIAQILGAALLLWPNQGFLRWARQELHERGTLSGSLTARLALHFVLSVLFVVVALLIANIIATWLGFGWGVVALSVIAIGLSQSTAEIGVVALQARARFESFNHAPLIQRSGQICGLAVIAIGDAASLLMTDVWVILAASTIAGYILSGINAWVRVPFALDWTSAGKRAWQIIGHSWTLSVTSMAAFTLAWIDVWLISALVGIESAGSYSFAYLATTLATAILAPIVAALLPRSIDQDIGGSDSEAARVRERIVSTVLLAGALAPLGVALAATALMVVPLGHYAAARLPLILLCSGVVFQFAMALGETIVYARAYLVRRYAIVVVSMVVVNLLLDLALIPLVDVEGAAIATVVTYAFGMIAQWALLSMPGWRVELLIYTAAGLGVATILMYDSLLAAFTAGLFATVALCVAGWSRGRFAPVLALLPTLRRVA